MKKIFIILAVFLLVCFNAYADSITLKSGRKIEGQIIEKSDEWVKVDTNGVKLTYFLDEVDNINGEKISITVKKTAAPAVARQPQAEQALKPQLTLQPGAPVASGIEAKKSNLPQINTGLALAFLSLLLVFGYIYPSLCLQFIAVKTNHHPVWLAWVPVGNLFLMCKIAKINYLWLLLLLLVFIPTLGLLVNLALGGFLWFKIAQARNKSGWLGILAVVPIVGLAVFAYLAFSE